MRGIKQYHIIITLVQRHIILLCDCRTEYQTVETRESFPEKREIKITFRSWLINTIII